MVFCYLRWSFNVFLSAEIFFTALLLLLYLNNSVVNAADLKIDFESSQITKHDLK